MNIDQVSMNDIVYKDMIRVVFKLFVALKEIAGSDLVEFEVEEGTGLLEALQRFASRYGPKMEEVMFSERGFNHYFTIILNKKVARKGDFDDYTLKNGDEIMIVPFVAGG